MNNSAADTSAQNISEEKELDLWVTAHLDEALEQHHIEVYYQPVIRTLNGSLCGFEALARWRDPERGMLSPAQFIAALEADNQIHKLDVYMIREVCRKLREEIDKGNRVVPVSFNLSRLDFFACDICHIIADYVSLYNLSVDLFHVEITESIITSNENRIRNDLNRLRAKGFSIWMDDFGSGYSSLNVLQDYHFDVIKIDMIFLRNFSDRSRKIITAVVAMAKTLGAQVLCEGVETREQFDFLREIGCNKAQGFLFSAPRPYESSMQEAIRKEPAELRAFHPYLYMETAAWRRYFIQSENVEFLGDYPLALLEYNGENFALIYGNYRFLRELESLGMGSLREAEQYINSFASATYGHYRKLARYLIKSGREESLVYVEGNDYVKITGIMLAQNEGHYMFRISLLNVTRSKDPSLLTSLDESIRGLYSTCRELLVFNYSEDIAERIVYNDGTLGTADKNRHQNIPLFLKIYAEAIICPEDRERFLSFVNRENFLSYAAGQQRSDRRGYFRVLSKGQKSWCFYIMLQLPSPKTDVIVLLSLDCEFENPDVNILP